MKDFFPRLRKKFCSNIHPFCRCLAIKPLPTGSMESSGLEDTLVQMDEVADLSRQLSGECATAINYLLRAELMLLRGEDHDAEILGRLLCLLKNGSPEKRLWTSSIYLKRPRNRRYQRCTASWVLLPKQSFHYANFDEKAKNTPKRPVSKKVIHCMIDRVGCFFVTPTNCSLITTAEGGDKH